MTLLTACRDAATELNQDELGTVFSNTAPFAREIRLQANRAAADIVQAYDWQKLTKLATFTGDGIKTAFDLPAGYDRMTKDAKVHSSSLPSSTFTKARDLSHWQYINENGLSNVPGTWVILGGQFNLIVGAADPMASGETATFYYVSNFSIAENESSAASKAAFTTDADVFALSERLLTLGMVWRWKASKGKDYSEELASYELALSQETGKDKGTRTLIVGRQRFPGNVEMAWPGVIAP